MKHSPKLSRQYRSRLRRRAEEIRAEGQSAGWGESRIAAVIVAELPDLHPLEAWRFACGLSRPAVITGVAALYRRAGLAAPALNPSMLCRWEHGDGAPGPEYADALCELYHARSDELGLRGRASLTALSPVGLRAGDRARGERTSAVSDPEWQRAAAVRASVLLAREAEGPEGGPVTIEQLDRATRYFDENYASFPPPVLAAEVHHCRGTAMLMLTAALPPELRWNLLRLSARLSALLGNLSHHVGDRTAAVVHLQTAAGLATATGDRRMLAWTLGARSMVVRPEDPALALELAADAVRATETPLQRAQALAWAHLPALVATGRAAEARDVMRAARRAMDIAADEHAPGRFGFDRAELEMHLAQAALDLGDLAASREHASRSLDATTVGRPGWVAASLVLAHGEAAAGRPGLGAQLALDVLDAVHADAVRSTSWDRVQNLVGFLARLGGQHRAVGDLSDRLAHRAVTVAPPTSQPVPGGVGAPAGRVPGQRQGRDPAAVGGAGLSRSR